MSLFSKHRKMRDVCLNVIEKTMENGNVVLDGIWINVAGKDPFVISSRKGVAREKLRIPFSTYQAEWRESKEPIK